MSQHKQKEQEQEALVLEALIIGAGPAGLIAAYHLKETCRFGPPPKYSSDSRGDTSSNRNDNYKSKNKYSRGRMVILEETSAPGGLWNRDPINREKIPCYCVDDSSIENDNDAKKSNHVDSTSGNKTRIAVETSSQPLYENLSVNFPKGTNFYNLFCFLGGWEVGSSFAIDIFWANLALLSSYLFTLNQKKYVFHFSHYFSIFLSIRSDVFL